MDEEVRWYQAVKASEKKYSAPMHVQLAIIYQESHFKSDAKPPRTKLFNEQPLKNKDSNNSVSFFINL
jgi:hypothetical protein